MNKRHLLETMLKAGGSESGDTEVQAGSAGNSHPSREVTSTVSAANLPAKPLPCTYDPDWPCDIIVCDCGDDPYWRLAKLPRSHP